MSFISELKRRNVFRVGIAYAVAAWLLVQVGDVARESFEAPAWVMKMVITALIAGLPVVLFFAWAFEITPDGIKREKDVDRSQSITNQTGQKLNYVVIAMLAVAIALVGLDRFLPERPTETTSNATLTAATGPEPAAEPAEPAIVTAPVNQNSIAVLPFVNMSNDPEQDYFSDGISEELLNLLAKVDGLNVASRTSSFAFKGQTTNIPDIASELRVRNVLEGSVRKSGNRVRITAQLIDTSNDRHLWSNSYDRELDDIFQVQDEIASAIVSALKTELGLELDSAEIEVTAVTEDMDAYDLYLRGRELTIARKNLFTAVELLERAVERDPAFARAWATLGMAAYLVPSWNLLDSEDEDAILDRSRAALNRALELDESQALPWAVLAMLITDYNEGSSGSHGESIRLLNKALELDPGNATAWLWRGIRHSEAGFIDDAIADTRRCLELEPAYQNCRRHLAVNYWINGDFDRAIDEYMDVARSGFSRNDSVYLSVFFSNGQELAGLVALSFYETAYPGFPARAYGEALEHPERDHSDKIPLAEAWLSSAEALPTGITEQLYLNFRAYDRLAIHNAFVNNWMWHPPYEHFRRSPHFQRIIRDLGLPAYWAERGLPPQCRQRDDEYECTSPAEARGAVPLVRTPLGDGT